MQVNPLPCIDFKVPKDCGGELVHGEKSRGCHHHVDTGVPVCFCLKKPMCNAPVTYAFIMEIKAARLHLSNCALDYGLAGELEGKG